MALSTPSKFGASSASGLTARITSGKRDVKGRVVEWVLLATLGVTLLILVALIVNLLDRAWPVLNGRFGDFLSSGLDASNAQEAGVWQAVRGTLTLAIIVIVVSFPLGIACAVYLEEYASRSRLARLIRINVRNLAGVPSIVYGILGLTIFVKFAGGITGDAPSSPVASPCRSWCCQSSSSRRRRHCARSLAPSAKVPWEWGPRNGRPCGRTCCPRRPPAF